MNGKSTHFAMVFTSEFHAYYQMTIFCPEIVIGSWGAFTYWSYKERW